MHGLFTLRINVGKGGGGGGGVGHESCGKKGMAREKTSTLGAVLM